MLYACSSNPGKLREFRVPPLPGLERIPAPVESGSSFEENASTKAAFYSGFSTELVFADDSGLSVDALDGAPGIYSARFAGQGATDEANNDLLLRCMSEIHQRTASYECVIALAQAGRVLQTFSGSVRGEVLSRRSAGTHGFGYDPLFFFPPLNKSFAELDPEQKWQVSHRGKAFRLMLQYLSASSAIR